MTIVRWAKSPILKNISIVSTKPDFRSYFLIVNRGVDIFEFKGRDYCHYVSQLTTNSNSNISWLIAIDELFTCALDVLCFKVFTDDLFRMALIGYGNTENQYRCEAS